MHDVLSVAITVATILIATYFSHSAINTLRNDVRSDISSLRGDMNSLRNEVRSDMHSLRSEMLSKMDSIQRDMRDFYAEQARHDTRITALERASEQR